MPSTISSDEKLAQQASKQVVGHRVDGPHPLRNGKPLLGSDATKPALESRAEPGRRQGFEKPAEIPLEGSASGNIHSEHEVDERREALLMLHSSDLIDELQRWLTDLDSREAQLNTRDALLDARQRQLRTWEKSQTLEINESRRSADRIEQEAKDRLRRLIAAEIHGHL
jgi:hypothetical protein